MPTIANNDLAVTKAAKTKVSKQTEYRIEGVPGLSLVVKASGVATYYVRYQRNMGGYNKQERQAIGRHGDTKFAEAKIKALDIARLAKQAPERGDDPKAPTLRQLFDQFEQWNRAAPSADAVAPRTLRDYREALERDVFKTLGSTKAHKMTRKEVATALTKAEMRSRNAAHKARAALGSTFKWAAKKMLVEENIMIGMGFVHVNKRRNRVPTDDEIKKIWSAIESEEFNAAEGTKYVLKLAVLTGQRNSEVAGARLSELKLNAEPPRWVIPGERMKRKDESQTIYLSEQAAALFREAKERFADDTFVFPGRVEDRRRNPHVTQDSVSHAMARACELAGVEDVHLHDMRKAIATWLGERATHPAIIDKVLHHRPVGVTATHYNFAGLADLCRAAWQGWADHVWDITGQAKTSPSNVVTLRA